MDNQFKNVKTHARLLSKAMWVEWRMKLLDGLKDGLLRVGEGMDEDDELLTQQKRLLESALPGLIQERDHLEVDRQILQARADELASWDQEELQDARDSLVAVENDLQTKEKIFEDVQSDSRRKDEGIEIALERERQCLEEIQEAEKILKDSQEWSPSGVATLQSMSCPKIHEIFVIIAYFGYSQRRCSGTSPWLDNCFCRWSELDDVVQAHASAVFHARIIHANHRVRFQTE